MRQLTALCTAIDSKLPKGHKPKDDPWLGVLRDEGHLAGVPVSGSSRIALAAVWLSRTPETTSETMFFGNWKQQEIGLEVQTSTSPVSSLIQRGYVVPCEHGVSACLIPILPKSEPKMMEMFIVDR